MNTNYAAQIAERSKKFVRDCGLNVTAKRRALIEAMAEEGFEIVHQTGYFGNGDEFIFAPVDETEFWTEEDWEEFRAETGESEEEFYGNVRV